MFHSPNDAAPLETRILLYVVIFSGYRLQDRDLRPLLAYSTGSVQNSSVEKRFYFALFLLRLHLNYLFRQMLQALQIYLH